MNVGREKMLELFRFAYKTIPFKRNFFTFLRRIYTPPRFINQHLYFDGKFDVKFDDARFAMINYNQSIETSVFWNGLEGYEKSSMRLWAALCRDSAVILDIGANSGLYSLVAKTLNPSARVYSFEPIDRFRAKLIRNCQLNHFDIKAESFAVSNQDGESVIYDLPYAHHGHASLIEDEARHAGRCLIERKISTKRLDTFIAEEKPNRVELMKIDVEGHEPEVLEGFGACLGKMRPNMLIEIKRLDQAHRIESLLADLDYLYFDINEETGPRQVPSLGPSSCYNFLICTPPTAARLNLLT
jgi:FkbM family methyltransferase